MTVARTVSDVLDDHVKFESPMSPGGGRPAGLKIGFSGQVECIDRMCLNVWVPGFAYGGGVAGFFVGHAATCTRRRR
jgi:hypothetical protein